MVGITSYGAYIPLLRLPRDVIAAAWGGRSSGGERAVANHDEDTVTMATEAAFDCLRGLDPSSVGGLFFASTTAPYREKPSSSSIAAVIELKPEIRTADFANTLRAGVTALRAAVDAVKAGSAKSVLVAVAEARMGFPRSAEEQNFGDGAAALLIGDSNVAAEIEGAASVSDEIIDVWRTDHDDFVRSWEDRWVLTYGYNRNTQRAITALMKEHSLTPKDVSKVVLYSPDGRAHQDLARSLGFDPKTQVQDPLAASVGNTGAAQPLMLLVAALETAKAGDRIIVAGYGGGSDALLLKVTEQIETIRDRRGVKGHLASKKAMGSYASFLAHRGQIEQAPELVVVGSAATILWRDRKWVYSFHGSQCKQCGAVQWPIQRICNSCKSKDNFEEVSLLGKKGKVFSYNLDNLAGGFDVPLVPTVVESETGARIYCLMTDCDPKAVKVDMPVEMTFRRFREARGFYNYFWKCRPLRGGE